MRLTVAAAVLAEASITAVASSPSSDDILKKSGLLFSNTASFLERKRLLSLITSPVDGSHEISDGNEGTSKIETTAQPLESFLPKKFSRISSKASLQNCHGSKLVQTECDPSITDGSAADVGILSCGPGQYCMESLDSASGGFCLETNIDIHRNLQNETIIDSVLNLCTKDASNPNLTCTTCQADATTYTGSFDCTFGSYCVKVRGLCGGGPKYEFCRSVAKDGTITAPGTYTYQTCTSIEKPVAFTYCTTVNFANDEASCELSINGATCTSCKLTFDTVNQKSCEIFNCENTDLKASGNSCGSNSFIDSLTAAYLYETLPCPDGCNLCGEGNVMENPTANFTFSNGFSLNCLSSQLAALSGYFSGTPYCTALPEFVQGPCGCGAAPPPTSPAPVTVPTPAPSGAVSTTTTAVVSLLGVSALAVTTLVG